MPSSLYQGLAARGAVPRFVGARLGTVESVDRDPIEVDAKLEAVPVVLYMRPNSSRNNIDCNCKPILMLGAGQDLVENAGVPLIVSTGHPDSGVLRFPDEHVEEALALFVEAITKHRFTAWNG